MSMFLKQNLNSLNYSNYSNYSNTLDVCFKYLESKNQLGNLSYILSISNNYFETVNYFFEIFSNILDEIVNVKGRNYLILSFFYDLVDLLKIKYNKNIHIIQFINACCGSIEKYMKNNIFSQKSNYELLNEIIKSKKPGFL
jgi:hypothetical protein